MPSIWFALIALMLTTYAVLDGFDFGAGIVHLFVAKTEDERKQVFGAIGPVWDGNEVWLIASGGVFVFAFPRAYAAAFSGLYLPLMMVLWLLVLRGLSIELRGKLDHPLWRSAHDAMFAFSSSVMAIVLGVALGNVLRGVPLDGTGYFQEDLFTDISPLGVGTTGRVGAIDMYTLLVGVFAAVTLAAHGATFLVWKTTGEVNARSRVLGGRLWLGAIGLALVVSGATWAVHRSYFDAFLARPWLFPLPALAIAAGVHARRTLVKSDALTPKDELVAFGASCFFLTAFLVTTAATLFPTLLRSTIDPALSLDIHNAASPHATLALGLVVWIPAMILATGYFAYLYRAHRGKVDPDAHGHD